jgi:hypothetical protein
MWLKKLLLSRPPANDVYCLTAADGARRWYRGGKLHRDDGPAVEYPNGNRFWYRFGRLDRAGGAACEYADGSRFWHRAGLLHRDDGPAVELPTGEKYWCRDGQCLKREYAENQRGAA